MTPTFYFAPGSRPARHDLDIALAVGQKHFLLPVGSSAIPWLMHQPGVRVVLDSAAWPPGNPSRPTLAQYAQAILAWRLPDGSWGNLVWAATYDHIGDPVATKRDHARLLALLGDLGASDAPVLPIGQYPGDLAAVVETARTVPAIGIGGLVPVLSPTQPRAVQAAADAWFDTTLDALAASGVGLHLFGIARPAFTCRSPLVASFDTSGPARMAQYGWPKVAPRYTACYGLSVGKLQRSRAARLAFWLLHTKARTGLPWQPVVDETIFPDDNVYGGAARHPAPSPFVQLSFESLLAA